MALLSVRALHNVLIPARREWERWMAIGSLHWGEPWSRAKELPSSWAAGHLIHEGALSRVSLQPLWSLHLWSGARASGLYLWL